jgi:hypothetical protein
MSNGEATGLCKTPVPLFLILGALQSSSCPAKQGSDAGTNRPPAAATRGSAEQKGSAMTRSCDFSRSFVTFVTPGRGNNARIQVEARCTILDRQTNQSEEFYLVASCKGEDTYGKGPLFLEPNYDFCGIFSNREFMLIRRHSNHRRDNETVATNAERFEALRIDLKLVDAEVLPDNPRIVQATLANRIINGRVQIADATARYEATIEFPIKTMNVNDIKMMYQVDTGPILLPNWNAEKKRAVERFDLAFVAYNRPDEAYFVIQTPTEVDVGDPKSPKVSHYSLTSRMPAKCEVIELR